MQKLILTSLVLTTLVSATILAQSRLKTANSVNIVNGAITETVVISDDSGQIFIEFIKGDRVAKSLDGQIYNGEILPPFRIDSPAKAPRARMRELLSFELISDTNESLDLIDQFTAMQAKERLRNSLRNQIDTRSQGAQIITLFNAAENINNPALWHYNAANLERPWERLGGIMGETPAGEDRVFSAYLYGTGTYTIWDENPLPTFEVSFPNDEIELAEPSPFPSITEEEEELFLFEDDEFTNLLEGEAALFEGESDPLLRGDDSRNSLVPAVGEDVLSNSFQLVPALPEENNSKTPNANQTNLVSSPNNSFLFTPSASSPALVPAVTPNEASSVNELSLAQALQASSFQDFGRQEGDLAEAGGFQFPWLLLIVFGITGFSFYALSKKPY